jgi:hypothetical protein
MSLALFFESYRFALYIESKESMKLISLRFSVSSTEKYIKLFLNFNLLLDKSIISKSHGIKKILFLYFGMKCT